MVGQVVVVLHRHKPFKAKVVADVERLGELVGLHRGRPDITNLPSTHYVVKRTQRMLDGRIVVPAMNLVEIYSLHSEAVQRVLEFLIDGLP